MEDIFNDIYNSAKEEEFEIIRNNKSLGKFKGIRKGKETIKPDIKPLKEEYVDFGQRQDIQVGDTLHDLLTDTKYIVIGLQPNEVKNPIMEGGTKNNIFRVYYISEYEYQKTNAGTTYNIGAATNSIIGNQQSAIIYINNFEQLQQEIEKCEPEDKPLLCELFNLLKQIEQNTKPIKKGMFAKFGDVLAKYSPIAIGVGQIIISLLTKQGI